MATTQTFTPASTARVKRFVDAFIRSEYVQMYHESGINSDYGLRGRFAHCHDAAEDGCDGSTHSEVINDWRRAFEGLLWDRCGHEWPERFAAAVNERFDSVESWHEKNGSLFQQIG